MSGEIFTSEETSQIIAELEAERDYWRKEPGICVDPVTVATPGSFWGRRWFEYERILHHNGAPNTLLQVLDQRNVSPRIVDAGCAAGLALADLRRYLPDAELHGIDVRNASLWTITDQSTGWNTTGRRLFSDHHIDFYQDSYHVVPDLVPSYDLLYCVGAMPDRSSSPAKQLYVLQQFYKGLSEGGYVQVLMQSSDNHLTGIMQKLISSGVEVQFTQGDNQVLQDNFFDSQNGLWGTLTLGPKSGK
ncbi:hypothetical protein IPM65_02180 [Candidatus Roizmanbacteria bacterium]|nr:MAG: hypothetical protein IPM65_02180 [Candidatus Roizmanbacteria bacterium]